MKHINTRHCTHLASLDHAEEVCALHCLEMMFVSVTRALKTYFLKTQKFETKTNDCVNQAFKLRQRPTAALLTT